MASGFDDYENIKAKIKKRKDRAKQLGVDKFMGKLFNDLRCYPKWFVSNKEYTPLITDARSLENEKRGDDVWGKWQITLKGNNYIFAFKDYPLSTSRGVYGHNGKFEVWKDDTKVLALDITLGTDPYQLKQEWSAFDIEAFIEGEWIQDFRELYDASVKAHEDGYKKIVRKPIDDLKKNFGIE